jgi:hypothetical protein
MTGSWTGFRYTFESGESIDIPVNFYIKFALWSQGRIHKLEKKYVPALDNYGQSCFVRSDFFKLVKYILYSMC